MKSDDKTNAMRLLDKNKIKYNRLSYAESEAISGVDVADFLQIERQRTFKTLVTQGKSGKYYVFDVPVSLELDLKKAAKAVNEKNIEMIKSKELFPLTGYIHGGCSPLGMKKFFQTTFDNTAENFESIYFSGGRIGAFLEVKICDLKKLIPVSFAPLT